MKAESWRDDFDLEPNTHPTIAQALYTMRGWQAAKMANDKASATAPHRWPFPAELIPADKRKPPPAHPDAEDAPW